MYDRWLLRASKWARNPPSAKKVRFVLIIIALCIAIYVVERYVGWPEWLSLERQGGRRGIR